MNYVIKYMKKQSTETSSVDSARSLNCRFLSAIIGHFFLLLGLLGTHSSPRQLMTLLSTEDNLAISQAYKMQPEATFSVIFEGS